MGHVSDTDRSAEISRDLFQKDFEILELSADAGVDEVETAYQTLTVAYSPDAVSMASPLKDEMEKQRRKEKLAEIEAAYRNLMRLFGETPPAAATDGRGCGGGRGARNGSNRAQGARLPGRCSSR